MLHASETWPLTKTNIQHLVQHNGSAMIRQICNIKLEDVASVRSNELLAFKLEDLDLILRERSLCWFGHVEHSGGGVRTACDIYIQVDGRPGSGKPKLTWKKLTENFCCEWKPMTVDSQERST